MSPEYKDTSAKLSWNSQPEGYKAVGRIAKDLGVSSQRIYSAAWQLGDVDSLHSGGGRSKRVWINESEIPRISDLIDAQKLGKKKS